VYQRQQEVLDGALEEEFEKTIEAMDEFVDQYGALETDDDLLAIKRHDIEKKGRIAATSTCQSIHQGHNTIASTS